jgi:hypothetical protein
LEPGAKREPCEEETLRPASWQPVMCVEIGVGLYAAAGAPAASLMGWVS